MLGITLAVGISWNFGYEWRRFPKVSRELFSEEYNLYRNTVWDRKVVYVDQFSLIGYYIQTHNWKWTISHRFHGQQRVDEYQLTSPSGEHVLLLRNLDSWNFDLMQPGFFPVFLQALRDSGSSAGTISFLQQFGADLTPAEQMRRKQTIKDLAGSFGLYTEQVVFDRANAFVSLSLR